MMALDRNLQEQIYLKNVYALIYNFSVFFSPIFSVLIAFLSVSMQYLILCMLLDFYCIGAKLVGLFLHAWDYMFAEFHLCLLRVLD